MTRHIEAAIGQPPLFDVEVVCCHEMKSSLAAKKRRKQLFPTMNPAVPSSV
jgi:hypothetical protein